MTPKPPSAYVGTRKFAELYDMNQDEVQRAAAAGRIVGAIKINGRWKICLDEYEASLRGRRPHGRPITVKRAGRVS